MFWFAVIGAVVIGWIVLVTLFTPAIDYHLRERVPTGTADFIRMLRAHCQTAIHGGNRVEVYTNGPSFYPAMIAAIRQARHSVNIECYIFMPGKVADEFIEALIDRAQNGVVVSLVADAIGSMWLFGKPVDKLRAAGCRVSTYQTIKWYSLARLNNRTHRELFVIDGKTAFMGGAGVADWWAYEHKGRPLWRDTMVRVDGPAVSSIQGVFAENWLECCGEILTGDIYFPPLDVEGDSTAFLVKSSPSDRATTVRVVFQSLIEGSRHTLRINTPYFLPDRQLRRAMCRAARRGVDIQVILPGSKTDQRWVRLASRRIYGSLLRSGVRLFEYRPAMMHCKMLIADGEWSVIGTTNMDNRSFEHNDEVNMVTLDRDVTTRLCEDFERDLTVCEEITLSAWQSRPLWEKALNPFVWILERQQ